MKPYRTNIEQVARYFGTRLHTGLSQKELEGRRVKYGPNTLPEAPHESWLHVFIRQFQNPLIYILLIAAVIIFIAGPDKLDAFIISGVLFFNAIIGTIQEGRTRSILESLKRYLVSTSVVLRDGKKLLVNDEDLVVGDIILLQEGQRIPADARIVESNNLQMDEAPLTGESKGVRKITDELEKEVPIADRVNMIYKGTHVLSGSGKALIVATGINTEIGKIHISVEEIQTDMPLRRELDRLSYWILLFILAMCIGMFFVGMAYGKPLNELLVMLTALFICVIPEGLPVVLTLVLVRGVYQMAQQNVLIKRMQAVEALGRTDVIVIDKTGTLTRNEMMVQEVVANGDIWQITGEGYHEQGEVTSETATLQDLNQESTLYQMGIASIVLNSTEIIPIPEMNLFDIKGDPTEAALYVFAHKLGLEPEHITQAYHKRYEIPFKSDARYHAGFFEKEGKGIVFIAGAPEELFERCRQVTDTMKASLERLLHDGLRVVAIARKEVPLTAYSNEDEDPEKKRVVYEQLVQTDLEILGLCGMQDSIRPEVRAIIDQAREIGIQVVMATGDHKETAEYVARRVGILREGNEVLEGEELNKLSDNELLDLLDNTTVYARVSPHEKIRIIELFHRKNKMVAMTGDGINDAPSLVAADLGIAMGRIGTEVAKEASDMVLLDDSFTSIMKAVEQGRYIFDSLKRVVLYFFATNMGEILIVLFALLANLPLPITAAQILWLNLVTDGFLDVALSMEPKEEGLLKQRVNANALHLIDWNLILKTMYVAVPMAIGSLIMFMIYYPINVVHARTMTMITMAMFQWFNAWNCRSLTQSLFQIGLFSNRWLILATSFVLLLQVAVTSIPFMQHIFKTVPLTMEQWIAIMLISSSVVVLEEVRKLVVRWMMRR